ncbi:DUF4279 domain-containing protein [Breznakiella homolactica]|uniref:DUF4279 domain-containing protein n=1 Tax=Breznakiella homolactica TaxID=2798577 RepID=A0A7T7XJV2_9SPIR|nr:DUF4279 domain-containing protein [Breznakiella homolactica]QQO07706.1 DUF4279 domain-containing protein [Breznakiella homolactica]
MSLSAKEIEDLKRIADAELKNPQWGLSKQFLEVNTIKTINDEYIYERYKIDNKEFRYAEAGKPAIIENHYEIAFYYMLQNQETFFCVGVDINTKNITRVFMVNASYCYLKAYSDDMTLMEMANLTKTKYSDGASKGEKTKRGFSPVSWIEYRFTNEKSYELEESLEMLLDELEQDKDGIKKLAEKTDANINICKYQYISGNAGISFTKEAINRLNELNLEVFIDMYIVGERMK